jgi:N-acyl-D-amino-acid deacylase
VFDVVLRGGWVVDGTGGPPYRADLAVTGGRVAALGRLDSAEARVRLDVTDRYLLPGFVDAHSHADGSAASADTQLAALRQGVTTVILGQDGLSFAPASGQTVAVVSQYFAAVDGSPPDEWSEGCSVAELLAYYDRATAINVGYLAPAGTIRAEVMGFADRSPDAGELVAMERLVERALVDGALGLSSGLEYVPGRFADAAELAALCRPVAEAGGPYVTHMRGYEAQAWRAMAEVARIAELSGVAAHVSHYHGPANMLRALVDDNRDRGLDITFDAYPYLRGSTILAMVALPPELSASPADTLARLADPGVRSRLARDWFPTVDDVLDRITLSFVGAAEWSWTEGLPLRKAASDADLDAGELVCELLLASDLRAGCVFAQPPTNTDDDMRALLRHEAHMAGSDGILVGGRPHPRAWGTFARLLGRHTRVLGDWTWGEAAWHLAGHPARRFRLAGRGMLLPGYAADVVVLDQASVSDVADYANPRALATGVDHVLVNGEFALRDGQLTGAQPGRALRGNDVLGSGPPRAFRHGLA